MDIIWNFAFVVVESAVLSLSWNETPSMPLRLLIVGYALQCILHMVCVCVEYRRRRRRTVAFSVVDGRGSAEYLSSEEDSARYVTLAQFGEEGTKYASTR